MNEEEASILQALTEGDFLLSIHAAERMKQRAVTRSDVQACGRTATICRYQPANRTYRVSGKDLDGEPLTVICGLSDTVIVVTIF